MDYIQIQCIPYYIHYIIHQNTPSSIWKKAQCRKTKLIVKLVIIFKEDAVQLSVYLYLFVYGYIPLLDESLSLPPFLLTLSNIPGIPK